MEKALPSLRLRIFRVLLFSNIFSILFITLCLEAITVVILHNHLREDISQFSDVFSHIAATNMSDREELYRHLKDISSQNGLRLACIYNTEGIVQAYWRTPDSRFCPSVIANAGSIFTFWDVIISTPIHSREGTYLGMLYIESEISLLRKIILQNILVVLGFMMVGALLAAFTAHPLSLRITSPLEQLKKHIVQLRHIRTCQYASTNTEKTAETHSLWQALVEHESHLSKMMVPREEMDALRYWHEETMAGFIARLRTRLAPDFALLPLISDYGLLLRIRAGVLPQDTVFDLRKIADQALASAKKIQPPGPDVHVTLSIAGEISRYWSGQPELVEALLRHLLLLSLLRTREGLICLRIETSRSSGQNSMPILYFALEDSGSPLAPAYIMQWTQPNMRNLCASNAIETSLLFISHLREALNGDIHVTSQKEDVLGLNGYIPLSPVPEYSPYRPENIIIADNTTQPLVLMVEDDNVNQFAQRALLEAHDIKVFTVQNGQQALEWASVLPVSLILLDMDLPDMPGTTIAQRLKISMDQGIMPTVPIHALTADDQPQAKAAWMKASVSNIWRKPMTDADVTEIKHFIKPIDQGFYLVADSDIQGEFSEQLRNRLPELQNALGDQIAQLLESLPADKHSSHRSFLEQAHAVKSAALSLGFQRLAGVMGAIEHAEKMQGHHLFQENLQRLHIAFASLFAPEITA